MFEKGMKWDAKVCYFRLHLVTSIGKKSYSKNKKNPKGTCLSAMETPYCPPHSKGTSHYKGSVIVVQGLAQFEVTKSLHIKK